jgi:hypothetical protein
MPKAGEGFSFFGFGSTNMPRRRRWGRTPSQNHFALDVWGIWRLAVAERRKKVAHGETVGEQTRLNQAPDGAKEICAGWFSVAPAGALVAG